MTAEGEAERQYRAVIGRPGEPPVVQEIPEFLVEAFRDSGWRIESRHHGAWEPVDG